MDCIDPSLPSNTYLKLVSKLPRRQAALLIRLHTGKTPLNRHLFEIKIRDSPACDSCSALGRLEEETVKHYLLDCPAHAAPRRALRGTLGARKASELRFLLSNAKATRAVMAYVDKTQRFTELLGTLSTPDEGEEDN